MGVEIERKFLVRGDAWRAGAVGVPYRQGYLPAEAGCTVRVRLAGETGYLTVKGKTEGLSRLEFEYPIPSADATELLNLLCLKPLIEKKRYRVEHAGHVWEVDEFFGDNAGLVTAEVELDDPEESVELPPWVGREVSDDYRYRNANLARNPYKNWRDEA
jgi:CYTH domain-containing protein